MNLFLDVLFNNQLNVLLGFSVTFIASIFIVLTKKYHGKISFDLNTGIQKVHKYSTPRIGGIGVLIGILIIIPLNTKGAISLFNLIIICSLPIFIIGLLEDLTKKISVRVRFSITALSALLYVFLSGFLIKDIGIEYINLYLSNPIISVIFTVFCISGVTNSINIIDGYHGLASGTSIIMLISIAIISDHYDDVELRNISITMSSIIFGFFIVNYPFGKLFLGDAGAYLIGFIISIFAMILPIRNDEISPWVSLLILIYPVTETIFSILRRLISKKQPISKPDDNHMHHRVHKLIVLKIYRYFNISRANNALTSTIMFSFPVSTLFWTMFSDYKAYDANNYILCFFLVYVIFYIATVVVERFLNA